MARPVYQYRPLEVNQKTIPLGVSLPFNKASGKRSVDALYNDPIQDAGAVFVSTYSTEEQAKSNVINLLSTAKGERYFQPEFGTQLRTLLFEQNVPDLKDQIDSSLKADIAFWLPYITVTKIDIVQPEHELIISVRFKILGTGANLVINILADENNFQVGPVETDAAQTSLVQINTFGGSVAGGGTSGGGGGGGY